MADGLLEDNGPGAKIVTRTDDLQPSLSLRFDQHPLNHA